MSRQEYVDVSEAPPSHNASAQHRVVENDDPALNTSYEHRHAHLHHDAHAEHRDNEAVYSESTTFEKSTIPHQDPQDHDLYRRRHADPAKTTAGVVDTEKCSMSPDNYPEDDPRTHSLSNFYARYCVFVHLFIWLFFTGSVTDSLCHHSLGSALEVGEAQDADIIIDGGLPA